MNKKHPLCRRLEELEVASSKAPAKVQPKQKETDQATTQKINESETTHWNFDPSICG